MKANVQHLIDIAQPHFNIIEEFAQLTAQRKMLLCDHLFSEGYVTYRSTVKLLWPQAEERHMRKLEKFLILLKETAH